MKHTDPICGMPGTIKAHGHYFCSQDCIRKYEKQHHIRKCFACEIKGAHRPWYKERLYIITLITVILVISSYFLSKALFAAFIDYFKLVWWAVLLGLFLGGVIDYYIPREYISKYLAQKKKRTIFLAVAFGFLMSACSHGILAISIELYKKGASVPAVVAFLLASPWANLPVTILLFGFFGLKALYIVACAIIIAIITGLIYQLLDSKGMIEKSRHTVEVKKGFSITKDISKRIHNYKFTAESAWKAFAGVMSGSWSLSKMVVWWILIGMVMASFARAFVPQHWFMMYLGPTVLGLLVTLVLAAIIEVCSEGSSPLAFEIFKQTGAFGNSFTFLMAGVATDYTEIGLLWSNIGKRTALWMPVITVPMILVLGYLFNLLL